MCVNPTQACVNLPRRVLTLTQVLESRLRGRGTESEAAVSKRLSNASAEILAADEPDFFQHVIVNDSLEDAFSQLKTILL